MTARTGEGDPMESGGPEFEIVHGAAAYTAEELLEQCQLNAQSLMLAVAAVTPGDDWPDALAGVFVRAWETGRAWEPAEVLDATLTNLRAFGAEIVAADFAQSPPAATVRNLPDPDLVQLLAATPEQADAFFHVCVALAKWLGMALSWQRLDNGDVTMTMAPAEPA